jgi:hypothetical protein
MKKQIVNFSTILLILFSVLIISCKTDDPSPSDIRMDVYPNYNNGIVSINVNNQSDQTYQLLIFDPEGNIIYERLGNKKSQMDFLFNLKEPKDRTGIFYAVLKTSTSTIKTRIFVV